MSTAAASIDPGLKAFMESGVAVIAATRDAANAPPSFAQAAAGSPMEGT